MYYSRHNIFSKIKDSENFFIVNLLSGNADILNSDDAGKIMQIRKGEEIAEGGFMNELSAKGYLVEEKEEINSFRNKYLDFLDARENDEIQLFFVPTYGCNFACPYCYQDEYIQPKQALKKEVVDAFFTYILKAFAGKRKYITVFGGEPLLDSKGQKEMIVYFIKKANESGIDLSFVTNGFTLTSYIEILKQAHIREIQVTLDGTASVHNKRRFLKGGGGTFNRIVEGIDVCIANHFTINLRMVVDKDNIENLPEFAKFAIEKGWTSSPNFKTQIGRNYELHHCQSSHNNLFSRISLYEKIFSLIVQFPYILEFHKPAFSISKFLSENGNLPDPLFDSCPACKTEWAFDYTGQIYPCTATVGKSDESLGTFYPEISLDKEAVRNWEKRDITTISDCKNCSVQLSCGGGCGSVAKNKTGTICPPDCRPVKELLELGFGTYFNK